MQEMEPDDLSNDCKDSTDTVRLWAASKKDGLENAVYYAHRAMMYFR